MPTTTPPAAPALRSRHAVAAVLCGAAALVLAVKGVRTLGPDPFGTVEPAWAALVLASALLAAAAAATALPRPRTATALAAPALLGSLVGDLLPTAPPRLLPLLPLAVALALLAVDAPGRAPGRSTALGWLALALHVAVGWAYLVSGLVAPAYGVLLLWALWGALLVLLVRLVHRRPAWALAVPVAAAGLWYLVMALGDQLLGWTP